VTTLARDLEAARKAIQDKTEALESAKASIASGDLHAPVEGVVSVDAVSQAIRSICR
jgi:multidrug resistance efflux pump